MKWLLLFIIPFVAAESDIQIYHGVIAASHNNDVNKFCVTYNPDWFTTTYERSVETAPKYPLYNIQRVIDGCETFSQGDFANKSVIIIDTGLCSVEKRTQNLVNAGAELIAIARKGGGLNVTNVQKSNFSTAPVVLINSNSYQTIKTLGSSQDLSLSFYIPVTRFDGNVIVIYLICIFCIVVGSYWSLYPKDMKISELWTTTPKPPIRLTLQTSDEVEEEDENKSSLWTNILFGIVIVSIMAGMLLLLYFAYKYFVFVFIALFCVIASTGMYSILFPLFAEIDCFNNRWQISICSKQHYFGPFKAALWLSCFSITLVWFAFRHEYNIWPLQVVMGISVCLNIIKSVPLPSLKIIAIIMVMLFIYDIFFVFITPYFTKDGVSIMERVATGSSSKKQVFDAPMDYSPGEQIPLSIKVPYFQATDLKVCMPIYGMIGFGDIVIPGLLTGYAAYFDTLAHPGETKWYYIITCTSYAVGLIITYIALIGMGIAQPALLYLVPCCLLGVFGTALKRGEVHAMWTGRAGVAAPRPMENEEVDS